MNDVKKGKPPPFGIAGGIVDLEDKLWSPVSGHNVLLKIRRIREYQRDHVFSF